MSKYIDIASTVQVIGSIYKNPSLLDNENYVFTEEDFPEEFQKIIFGSMYNLYKLGAKEISINTIEDYLKDRPKALGVYKARKGADFLQKASDNIQVSTFDYYYSRLKKMTLLRMYDNAGLNLNWLYDPNNILDSSKREAQEDWFDNTSIEDMAEMIDKKITDIRLKYVNDLADMSVQAGEGGEELLESLLKTPEYGYPLFGPLINTVTRGARLGKVYLRSAPSGVGKSRSMIADACFIGCDELYNSTTKKWEQNGTREPVLYITTEQDVSEIQTMMIAFLSGVNEEHILTGKYEVGEWDRAVHAAQLLKKCPIYIQELHDFSLQDIENTLKKAIHDHNVRYVFHDYIHTSVKILSEISTKSKVAGLREDNILFLIGVKLKDLAVQYQIFIMSATQLNGDWKEARVPDQNLLRGAKSLADKIDMGCILLNSTAEDLEALKGYCFPRNIQLPDTKISIYKNRRGKYRGIYLWCKSDKGTCRIEPMFATSYDYEKVDMEDTKIRIDSSIQSSAF